MLLRRRGWYDIFFLPFAGINKKKVTCISSLCILNIIYFRIKILVWGLDVKQSGYSSRVTTVKTTPWDHDVSGLDYTPIMGSLQAV